MEGFGFGVLCLQHGCNQRPSRLEVSLAASEGLLPKLCKISML